MSTTERNQPKIVVIGGGSGSSVLLRGLKAHTTDITSIVTMFDSGGSSGILRDEFGYPPLGDLRQCLVALAEDDGNTAALRMAFNFRFSKKSSLNGHSVGNLILAALTSRHQGLQGAIDEMSQMLKLRGRVMPVTLERADLCAELEDGTVVRTEAAIDLRGEETPAIRRVFLDREVAANPRAIEAILQADAVVLGPGDLYTSIVPNLLAGGIPEALRETKAPIIYVCNLMTKLGETGGYGASDFAAAIVRYLGGRKIDFAVVHTEPVPDEIREQYAAEGATPVNPDLEDLSLHAREIVTGVYANPGPKFRHDQERLAYAVLSVAIGKGAAPTGAARHTRAARIGQVADLAFDSHT
ncbi:MAG: gluconeogenesis factor YvcK family protein [Dehalococcoidia bacterium]